MSLMETCPKTIVTKLVAKNFRNIAQKNMQFSPKLNLFVGPNGLGKTNCLEAISLAYSLRPMQSLTNIDLIKHGCDMASINAELSGAKTLVTDIEIFSQGKKVKINNKQLNRSSNYIKDLPVVTFIPAELSMLTGAASLRRKAIDQAASALFFEHRISLKNYEKLLSNRNKILKTYPLDKTYLRTFTELFLEEAALVTMYRIKAMELLKDYFQAELKKILGPNNHCELGYFCKERDISTYALSDIKALLEQSQQHYEQEEQFRRLSLWGPHLDDLKFTLNQLDAKKSASRGQTRALVLAFKLAKMNAIVKIRGDAPVIILDDIISELDEKRRDNLMQVIDHLDSQSFFSATDTFGFESIAKTAEIFDLNDH